MIDRAATKAVIGRADLLRFLAVAPCDRLTLDDGADGWFGYVRTPTEPPPLVLDLPAVPRPRTEPEQREAPRRLPLQIPFMPLIVCREPRAPAVEAELPGQETGGRFDDQRLRPREPRRLVGDEDLVPWPRLLPALRRQLGARRFGRLDVPRLARCIAAGEIPRRLPRRVHGRWHPDLVVVLDFAPRLWPYRADMDGLATRLVRLVGAGRVSLRVIKHGPLGPWTDWLDLQDPDGPLPPEHRWRMPPAGTPVLLVTDASLLLGSDSPAAAAWRAFIGRLAQAQLKPLALMPLGSTQLDASLSVPVLRWSPDARPHPLRARGAGQPQPPGLDDLLALASVIRCIDPPLLRVLRRLVPEAPLNAGLEGALWCHADVQASFSATLPPAKAVPHRERFKNWLTALHAQVREHQARHHAHLNRGLDHEELLLWDAYADRALARDETALAEARQFLRDLANTVSFANDVPDDWLRIAYGMVSRADTAMRRRNPGLYQRLAAACIKASPALPVPAWADPKAVAQVLAGDREGGSAWLVADAERGQVLLQATAPGPRQSPLGPAVDFDAGGIAWSRTEEEPARFLWSNDLPIAVTSVGDTGASAHLSTSAERIDVAAVRRPRGVRGWGFDDQGLFVQSPSLGPVAYDFRSNGRPPVLRFARGADGGWACEADAALAGRRSYQRQREGSSTGESSHPGNAIPPSPKGEWSIAIRFGLDAFGVHAEFDLETRQGSATQRFRWIEPGSFWMGSPEDEPGRDGDEGPRRHSVTITRGLWLADTPCTQGLWQAVMGDNPSRFQSPDRPVEEVSWEDVQRFLAALEMRLPGCGASLPTEAEWEYACRAGTTGAIYTGDIEILGANNAPALDPIAWYGGNSGVGFELADGLDSSAWPDKQYPHSRAGTMPVARKRPNAWGLYDMLGNVWEWCADDQRSYTDEPQVDPFGATGEGVSARRVIRGGSWIDDARWCRSADRLADRPGGAGRYLGFRLSLRSIEPGPAGGRPGGPAEIAPGGRPPASPRDEAEPAGFFSRVQQRLGRATKKAPKKKR